MRYLNKLKIFSLAGVAAAIMFSGCQKLSDFGNTNDRTDASIEPLTSNLLTSALSYIAGYQASVRGGIRCELYAQQWAETQYTDVSTYANPQLDFGGVYSSPLMDLQTIINRNTDPATKSSLFVLGTPNKPNGSNANQIAVATIAKVYLLWITTDRWGDIPYSEALQASADLTPKYDTQEEIYSHMLSDLKNAVAGFDDGPGVDGDFYYNGNNDQWKKLANSLRMLIALRMSKVYPNAGQLAATEFADAANDPAGSIDNNADNFVRSYSGSSVAETNPFYSALNGRKDYALSLTLSDILANMNDPRRNSFGSAGAPFPYGLPREDAVAFGNSVSGAYSKPFAPSFVQATTPVVTIPASYTLLAKAEAAQRGWISGSAETYYNAGVTASFEQWGVTGADTYLASDEANFATGTGGGNQIGFLGDYPAVPNQDAYTTTPLQRIQLQRYIASFGDGVQAWCEWRRTGIPNLKPTVYATNNPKEIPRRLTYGTSEYALNKDNVEAAAALLSGGDVMNARMWWDQ